MYVYSRAYTFSPLNGSPFAASEVAVTEPSYTGCSTNSCRTPPEFEVRGDVAGRVHAKVTLVPCQYPYKEQG